MASLGACGVPTKLALYTHCVYSARMAKSKEPSATKAAEPRTKAKDRWDFRVDSDTARLVRHAAATADRTLTDFVVDAAVIEAKRLLADRTHFVLEVDQWNRFVELLDRSPQDTPGLERLFSRPSVFADE